MDESYRARQMRELDEGNRDSLIASCPNCVDAREHFERRSLDGKEVTMPFPWISDGDDYA